jgi:hypothetical protein
MYKLGHLVDGTWIEHSHSRVFMLPESSAVSQRIVAAVPFGDPQVFLHLVAALTPPYFLLYVLHTPRGEGEPGRYQSPELSMDELQAFFEEFGDFLSQDGRFDIWAYSPSEQASVIWDRHNQIFAYGPLSRFESELRDLGFAQGIVSIPAPHEHHYRSEFDEKAERVLRSFEWSHSPLGYEDEQ